MTSDTELLQPARIVPLTHGWLFGGPIVDEAAAAQPGYDIDGFESVTLPHCAVPLSWRDWSYETWEHIWCYRQRFDLPPDVEGSRVFLDVDGALHAARIYLNGELVGEQRGGYASFSHELSGRAVAEGNQLMIAVDARWLPVPPNGHPDGAPGVDFFQPGGISRGVRLRIVPAVFVTDVFARPVDVLDDNRRRVEVSCTVDADRPFTGSAEVALIGPDGGTVCRRTVDLDDPASPTFQVTLDRIGRVKLWELEQPTLYEIAVRLRVGATASHEHRVRIGFREARFELDGFFLNGRRVELTGLNRHQIYPYTGMAMPARVQRRDAAILRHELNCVMVRCAHYPQSADFLDACDEEGLLVFEEIPGWQYVGDEAWQDLVLRDVEQLIRRDRNRPSIVVWGIRVNESPNQPELYRRTQEIAERLDPSRPTSGAMLANRYSTDGFDQDVFGYNDYDANDEGAVLRPPLAGVPYLVTEAIGSLVGPHYYRRTDPHQVQARQAFLHAQVHHQAAADDRYAGVLAWQAFDYDSLNGRIDHRLKCNGVADTFRIPKLGASIYQAQVDPRHRPVIAPAFHWDHPLDDREAMVCSNCDRLEVFVGDDHHATVLPDRERFGALRYPPSFVELRLTTEACPDLRIDGYLGTERALSRLFSADRSADKLELTADDTTLVGDGSDATRVVFQGVDRYGALRPSAGGEVELTVEGPGDLIGDNPFPLDRNGGAGAVWIRSRTGSAGRILLTASHPRLGTATATIHVSGTEVQPLAE